MTLRGAKLRAVVGDMGIDGALPTLWPMAIVVERQGKLSTVSVGGDTEHRRARPLEHQPLSWSQSARRAQ